MNKPVLEVLPLRPAVSSESTTTLEVMLRVTPPPVPMGAERPLLNLALVIDRSGSMGGEKLNYAKRAASYAVENLLPGDRVSVVTYDDHVQVLVPSTLAQDKAGIIRQIRSVHTGGSTALHAGWLEGAQQVSTHLDAERLNRVILLSDGLANVGETNPDVIASDVSGLKEHGVSTSTIGVGRDFSEDLMQALAMSGEGNFYFIESPEQLPDIFGAELQGLMATRGRKVRLELRSEHGTRITELFNDFKTDERGQLMLPDLIAGMPILLAGTLQVPPLKTLGPIGELRLAWDDPDSGKRETLTQSVHLNALPDVKLNSLPTNPEVESYLAELRAMRAKEEAIRRLDRGDRAGMMQQVAVAKQFIQAAPATPRTQAELRELEHLSEAVQRRDDVITRKRMHDQVYRKKFSRGEGALKPSRPDKVAAVPDKAERIAVAMGDITKEQVDAIVNPTNTGLFGTAGVDGAVHRSAGPELTRACREIGRCEPGAAVFTEGFNLPAKFVIHTVGPVWQGGQHGEAKQLASAYRSSLLLARRLGVRTISFPSISTGIHHYPLAEAAKIAVGEIRSFLEQDSSIEQLRIVCFDAATFQAYQKVLSDKLQAPTANAKASPPRPTGG